jgi:hypothetical protein
MSPSARRGKLIFSPLLHFVSFAIVLCGVAPLAAQTPGFTSFDAPHAGTLFNTGTHAVKINANGMIAGYYIDTSGWNSHGFIRKADGNFIEFDVPGLYDVTVSSMNNSGDVVGWGGHESGSVIRTQGFLRFANGKIIQLNIPGTVGNSPEGINDGGVVAGTYFDSKGDHGFIRDANGNYTLFDDPDVVTGKEERGTYVRGIESNGTVVGYYTGKTGTGHGYIRDEFGNFTNFDAPDAGSGFLIGTFPRSINEAGEVTGYYVDTHGDDHGFVRDAQGTLTEFSGPDASYTVAFSSNNSGKTVGIWASEEFGGGFVRDSSGALTTFSVPLRNTGTQPSDINDAGQIAGSWVDAGQRAYHGFVQVN